MIPSYVIQKPLRKNNKKAKYVVYSDDFEKMKYFETIEESLAWLIENSGNLIIKKSNKFLIECFKNFQISNEQSNSNQNKQIDLKKWEACDENKENTNLKKVNQEVSQEDSDQENVPNTSNFYSKFNTINLKIYKRLLT